jgi:hypothetical protein
MPLKVKDQKTINEIIQDLTLSDEEKATLDELQQNGDYRKLIIILESYLKNDLLRENQLMKLRDQVEKIDEEALKTERKDEDKSLLDDLTNAELLKLKLNRVAQEKADEEFIEMISEETDKVESGLTKVAEEARADAENQKINDVRNKLK